MQIDLYESNHCDAVPVLHTTRFAEQANSDSRGFIADVSISVVLEVVTDFSTTVVTGLLERVVFLHRVLRNPGGIRSTRISFFLRNLLLFLVSFRLCAGRGINSLNCLSCGDFGHLTTDFVKRLCDTVESRCYSTEQ